MQKGIVTVSWGSLNIRDLPDLNAAVLTSAPGGAELTVYGVSGNWYSVSYRGIVGYASTAFVVLQ